MTYSQADRQLTGRCKDRRKVGNNTYLERVSDECIGLLLYSTYVLKWWKDGRIEIRTGGHDTHTTWNRIRGEFPGRIWKYGDRVTGKDVININGAGYVLTKFPVTVHANGVVYCGDKQAEPWDRDAEIQARKHRRKAEADRLKEIWREAEREFKAAGLHRESRVIRYDDNRGTTVDVKTGKCWVNRSGEFGIHPALHHTYSFTTKHPYSFTTKRREFRLTHLPSSLLLHESTSAALCLEFMTKAEGMADDIAAAGVFRKLGFPNQELEREIARGMYDR